MSYQARQFEVDLARFTDAQSRTAGTQQAVRPPIIVNPPPRHEVTGWIKKGLGLFVGATAVFWALGRMQETDAKVSGSSTFLDMRDGYSVSIQDYKKPAVGRSIHDNMDPVKDSWAQTVGFINTQLEYVPNGSLELTAVDDPDIGFYILAREREGEVSRPLSFTFDTPDEKEDNRATIHLRLEDPEPCNIEIKEKDDGEGNDVIPADYCTPLTSENSLGLYSDSANEGPAGAIDNTVASEAETAFDVSARNAYCELAALGTPSIERMIRGDMSGITQESIHDGAMAAVMAAVRMDLSSQYGLPLTNEYGGFTILNDIEVAMNRQIVKNAGKPLTQLTPDEYRQYARGVYLDNLLDRSGKTIDPGPTMPTQMLDLKDFVSSDIRLPEDEPPITRENANSSRWAYMCIPANSERADGPKLVHDEWVRNRAGKLGELPAFAVINTDASGEQPMVQTVAPALAISRLDAFREARDI